MNELNLSIVIWLLSSFPAAPSGATGPAITGGAATAGGIAEAQAEVSNRTTRAIRRMANSAKDGADWRRSPGPAQARRDASRIR